MSTRVHVEASEGRHASFRSHDGDVVREFPILQTAPMELFEGDDGAAGLEPLLALIADVVDMDLVLVGHVNAEEYTTVAWHSRNPELTFERGGKIPIGHTYCREEITAEAPFAIGDAAKDPKYCNHPGFTEEGLRAYVGVPLVLEDGTLFGTVCGVDTKPRRVTPEGVERIVLLAGMLSSEISRRLGLKHVSESERALARAADTYRTHLASLARGHAERDARIRTLHESLTEANRAQAQTIRRLESANRELEAFTYTVSHDLAEPLRGIETLTQMIAEDAATAPREELRSLAERARADGLVLKRRVKGLLELSRIMRAEWEPEETDMHAVAVTVVESLTRTIRDAGAEVTVQESPRLPRVTGQRVRLEQVLTNLVANAVKHNPERRVRVHVGWEPGPHGTPIFHVRDDGGGVPPEWRDRVFEVFRRGPASMDVTGTGVGLTISAKVVALHGGRIWIEDTPGGGATFRFTLAATGEP